jgi:hypothetical protein
MIPLFIFIFFFTVVHFGQVTVREFQRSVGGGGGIPDHGGWALGLGVHVRDFHAGSIEEIEIRKDKIIQDKLNQQKRRNNSGSHDSKSPKNNTTTMKITKILKPQALTQDQRKELFRKDLVDANVFERLTKRESFDEEEKQKVKQEKKLLTKVSPLSPIDADKRRKGIANCMIRQMNGTVAPLPSTAR